MSGIYEVATINSKGQITLPKAIRQSLGVDYGGKVAFDLRASQVIVTRADVSSQEDPAIRAFLALLEAGIRSGQNLCTLPEDLVHSMLSTLAQRVELTTDSQNDVAGKVDSP